MYTLTLTKNDHLTFQLYEASTNPLKIKSRRRSFFNFFPPGILIILCGYIVNNTVHIYVGVSWILLALCFSKIYIKWYHKRHYSKHVDNVYVQSEEIVRIEISSDEIRLIDKVTDCSIKISEITLVREIRDLYFLQFSTGPKMMIPKTISALNAEIELMIKNHNIPHVIQLDWKW